MKTITLTISPKYVSDWEEWQAVRELLQNAYDQKDRDPKCEVEVTHSRDVLSIHTTTGNLSVQSLLLGETDKANDSSLRGKFGEGYKLAFLVLIRSNHKVRVGNGSETWVPYIEHDATFNCDVMKIDILEAYIATEGVRIMVDGIDSAMWSDFYDNICEVKGDTILHDPNQKGRMYVGGLYVTTMPEFSAGYSFKPSTVRLDRDRGMISGWDVRSETSKLWLKEDSEETYELIKAEAPDVDYIEHYTSKESPIVTSVYGYYSRSYGEAIPVASQEQIQAAVKAGVKYQLVPAKILRLLQKVKAWIIPSTKPPVEMLKDFIESHRYSLNKVQHGELYEIVKKMEPA